MAGGMTFAVVGAGAIGGLLGARLALAGEDVTFVVRGVNLAVIGQSGLRLIEADGSERVDLGRLGIVWKGPGVRFSSHPPAMNIREDLSPIDFAEPIALRDVLY